MPSAANIHPKVVIVPPNISPGSYVLVASTPFGEVRARMMIRT